MNSGLVTGNVVLTSSVVEDGRQFACVGEMVTFTCQVIGSSSLEWSSPSFSPITYLAGSMPPIGTPRAPFFANLISVTGGGLNTNFVSTLEVNGSRTSPQNDTTVECRNQQLESREASLTTAGD